VIQGRIVENYVPAQESAENLELMRLLDEQFMKTFSFR
jgi:hypothetical protein